MFLYRRGILASVLIILSVVLVRADDCKTNCEVQYGISDAEIATYPPPNLNTLPVSEDLLYDRYYQQTTGNLEIFDAPNGNLIGSLDAGFNFVTSINAQDGWTEINPGQWTRSDSLTNSMGGISHFSGILLPQETPQYPVAWSLVNMYPSKQPSSEPNEANNLIWRYTRLNLYASVDIHGEVWYQVGVDQWVHQHHVAKIIPIERPADVDTNLWVSIDLYEQVLIAYEGVTPVFATLISSGLPRWPTYEGLFHIYFRRTRDNMSGGQPGDDFYFLEEVPWTMFFDEGRALHGAYWHDGFGYRRSHGCVNMSITDAHWLYLWVAEEMGSMNSPDQEVGPAVFVYSSGQYQ